MIEGYPIFDRIPDFANDPVSDADSIVSKETTGLRDYIRWDARPLINLTQNHTFDSLEPVDEVLQQFITNMGAAGSFWVPTWQPDFSMAAGLANGLNELVIHPVSYEDTYLTGTSVTEPGHYLAIYNEDTGTLFTPKVLSVSIDEGSGNETLTLSENAPEDFFTGTTIVSLLILCRHLDDTLEIDWKSPDIAEVNLDMVQTRTFNAAPIVQAYTDPELLPPLNRQLKTNGNITSMESEGSKVFLVGDFTSADVIENIGTNENIIWDTTETNTRNNAAAFNMDTGVWDSWNPPLFTSSPKHMLVDDKVYVSSHLTSPYIKAYDKNTGAEDSVFNPDVRSVTGTTKIYKTGGKVILAGSNPINYFGRVSAFSVGDFEVSRPFHILDSNGEPLPETFNDLPADADVLVLCVHDGYIYFASHSNYEYSNLGYVLEGGNFANLSGSISLDATNHRVVFTDASDTLSFVNSEFIEISGSSDFFNNQPFKVYSVNTIVGYIQLEFDSLTSDDTSPSLEISYVDLVETSSNLNNVYSIKVFPELLIDIKPKGIYRMSVDGKFDFSFKSDISKSDWNWSQFSPIIAFPDGENNKLIVYGKQGIDVLGTWVLDLETGDVPSKFSELGGPVGTPGFGIVDVDKIEPIGNYLIATGYFNEFGGVIKCEKTTGSIKTTYGIGFDERSAYSVSAVNPDGNSIWIGESSSSTAHTNLYKTLPTDGRYLDVPDLS